MACRVAEALLRGLRSLSAGERELIAAYTLQLNATPFCCSSHSAFAAAQLVARDGVSVTWSGGGSLVLVWSCLWNRFRSYVS